jgi:hypothetical protein
VWGKVSARNSAWLLGCLLFVGCAASKVYVSDKYVASGKVAILPMVNESNDLDGPIFVRKLIQGGMLVRGFQVLPPTDVDAQLKTQGFTDGGQLRATTPQKIGEWTGADTLLYSTLEDFNYINIGFYAQRQVKVLAQLVDAKTGERLWESEREGTTRVVVADKKEAERQFAVQLAVKAVEKMTHLPLQAESRMAVERILSTLPYRP